MPHVVHTLVDNSGERSTTKFYLPDMTAVNYTQVSGNGALENVGALRLAVAAVSTANFVNHQVQAVNYPESAGLPADPYSQREIKLLVQYIDTVTARAYTLTIPSPDLTLLAQTGTDIVDHTSNVTAIALTVAMETFAVSQDGNAITVTGMRIVGRNN